MAAMAISNAECVGKALELLNQGLFSLMKRELKAFYVDNWFEQGSPKAVAIYYIALNI